MNEDKELLTLAAKAAGIEILLWNNVFKNVTGSHPASNMFAFPIWNPLTDDGDALRLAVKLEMNLFFGLAKIFVEIPSDGDEPSIVEKNEKGDDPFLATRSAIVRAAAEIGRGME